MRIWQLSAASRLQPLAMSIPVVARDWMDP
jgi:hypothetical protein